MFGAHAALQMRQTGSDCRQLKHTRRSDGTPEPDGALKAVVRATIIHYRQVYLNHPDPISFIPLTVDTSGRIYDDFSRLLFLNTHRESSTLANELPEIDLGESVVVYYESMKRKLI
jgi:hypothetical protein